MSMYQKSEKRPPKNVRICRTWVDLVFELLLLGLMLAFLIWVGSAALFLVVLLLFGCLFYSCWNHGALLFDEEGFRHIKKEKVLTCCRWDEIRSVEYKDTSIIRSYPILIVCLKNGQSYEYDLGNFASIEDLLLFKHVFRNLQEICKKHDVPYDRYLLLGKYKIRDKGRFSIKVERLKSECKKIVKMK